MSVPSLLQRLTASPRTAPLASLMLVQLAESSTVGEFLERFLPELVQGAGASWGTVYRAERGVWSARLTTGRTPQSEIDLDLLSDALDRGQGVVRGNLAASPLDLHPTPDSPGECLAVSYDKLSRDAAQDVEALASLLGIGLASVRTRQADVRRIGRLEAILEIAGQWNQNLHMDSLLEQMAKTSTRLLDAERASIFLWDKRNQVLVGRPALGVEGNELRIPDRVGIVGEVVQTGEPRRVDESDDHQIIHRDVDKQLAFHTKTLLCVPLHDRDGKILGAFEMINKRHGNFTIEDQTGLIELASHASIALANTKQFQQLLESRKQMVEQAAGKVQLIGQSTQLEQLRHTVRRVADTDLALLVLGENGTGKEVVSQMVHYLSPRRNEPFVAVNCAALAETLLESELFGHEKGAFTDAHEARAGKFELASGGTLFLDEIGDLSLGGQAKLLRVLEEKIVVRVGGSVPIPTNTRVIAATNQNLGQMVKNKKFREDLFFRLNVVTLTLPPLRERVDDIPLLADHFLHDFCQKARRTVPKFSAEASKRLRQHPWPGNVRELRNLMERLAYLTPGDRIDVEDLAFILPPDRDAIPFSLELTLTDATRDFQIGYIRKQIASAGGNMSDAARRMGLHRSNLYRKMRQLEMQESEGELDLED